MKKSILIISIVALFALLLAIPIASATQGITWVKPAANSTTIRGNYDLNVTLTETASTVSFYFREATSGAFTLINNTATGNLTTFTATFKTTQTHDNGSVYQLMANASNWTASASTNLSSITIDNTNVSFSSLGPSDNEILDEQGFGLSAILKNSTGICYVSISRPNTDVFDRTKATFSASNETCSYSYGSSSPVDGIYRWFMSATDDTLEKSSPIYEFVMDDGSGGFDVQAYLAAVEASKKTGGTTTPGAGGGFNKNIIIGIIVVIAIIAIAGGKKK